MIGSKLSYAEWFDRACGHISADMNLIHEALNRAPSGPILDLGCGAGRILNLNLDRELILADASPDFLEITKKKARGNDQIKVIEAKAPHLPLADNSIAVVTLMNNTLAELSPICFTVAEIARVLAEGGTVYAALRNPNCVSEMTFGSRAINIGNEKIYSSYESFRMQSLGKNHYQTKVTIRTSRCIETNYYIPQYYITRDELNKIAEQCRLKEVLCSGGFNGEPFDEEKSPIMVWVAQKDSKKEDPVRFEYTRVFYDNNASHYDEIVKNARFGVIPWFQEAATNISDAPYRILDLACGSGTIGDAMRSLGQTGEIYGIDFSEKMLDAARRKQIYNGLGKFDLNRGLPVFESHMFDLITFSSGSEFIENIDLLLQQCARTLVRRGHLYISFELTTPKSAPSGQEDPVNKLVRFHYTKQEAEELVTTSGLEIQGSHEIIGYFSPTLKRNIPYICIKAARVKF